MFKNYIKIAFRNLLKQKLFSFINIFGLGFGIACVLLITLYVNEELSYDQFHDNADDIYRISWVTDNPQTRTPHPMALAMTKDFPQVVAGTSLSPLWGPGLTRRSFAIWNPEANVKFEEKAILSVDSTFFDVFDFKLIKGSENEVMRNIGGVLLSETAAKKYFGSEDPIGKQLAVDDAEALVQVEGIFEDVPEASHFHFDILISYVTLKAMDPTNEYYTWADFGHFNYIRLQSGSDPIQLQDQIMKWSLKYIQVSEEEMQQAMDAGMHFELQRLTDIHLHSQIRWELEPNGNIEYVIIMIGAAFLILIIACVNFMNLSTARSTERSKEIGLRKSLGAIKGQVMLQFLGESILIAVLATVLGGLIAEISIPFFNQVTGKNLDIHYLQDPYIFILLGGCGILTGLISGLYAALFMSSLTPVKSLKGVGKLKPKGAWLRKGLLIFQFIASMILITGSLLIYNQLDYIKNKDLGFNKEAVISVPIKNYELTNRLEALKNELLKIEEITAVSAASNLPGGQFNQNSIHSIDNPDNRINTSEVFVDYDIFKTLGIELLDGRVFSEDYPADSANAIVINEVAAKNLALVVGDEFTWDCDASFCPLRGTVIGIVKDFNFHSLHRPVQPLILKLNPWYNHVVIKLNTENFGRSLERIEQVWSQFEDDFGFEFSFLSEDLNDMYRSEEKTAQVFGGFSVIAVIIACFGLFGLASLSYVHRIKEVCIRKVMGASIWNLLTLLTKDFAKLVLISITVAIPLSWWLMSTWLQNFTFKVAPKSRIFFTGRIVVTNCSTAHRCHSYSKNSSEEPS